MHKGNTEFHNARVREPSGSSRMPRAAARCRLKSTTCTSSILIDIADHPFVLCIPDRPTTFGCKELNLTLSSKRSPTSGLLRTIAFTYRLPTFRCGVFFRCRMISTEAFCTACICNVALGDTSPEATRFVEASRYSNKKEMLIGDDGICYHCGKSGLVVRCMIPEST